MPCSGSEVCDGVIKPLSMRLKPLLICNDNQSAIALVKNPQKHSRTKHIDIRHHFIREHYQSGDITLDHVESERNVADIFTKPASKPKLLGFRKQVFGQ